MEQLTDKDAEKAAQEDSDNPPLTKRQLRKAFRAVDVQSIRKKLQLTQKEFSRKFHLPLGTIRDWEQKRTQPDVAAILLLKVIDSNLKVVQKVLSQEH